MTGTKVERVERTASARLEQFVVGKRARGRTAPRRRSAQRVHGRRRRPASRADRLRRAERRRRARRVAVARPGRGDAGRDASSAKAKLRGVESDGMILAEDELAIGTDHAGILVLEQDGLEPGTPLRARCCRSRPRCSSWRSPRTGPDCLGIYGVAREVHAATGAPLAPPPWADDPGQPGRRSTATEITVEAPTCVRGSPRAYSRTSRSGRARRG